MGDQGSIPGSGRSHGKGNSYPLQDSCLENSTDGEFLHVLALLVYCHPWARKESDTTEQLMLSLSKHLQRHSYRTLIRNNIHVGTTKESLRNRSSSP